MHPKDLKLEAIAEAMAPAFETVGELGSGGQRRVVEVSDGESNYALKLMEMSESDRAEREVEIGRQFDHPGLVKIQSELIEVSVEGEGFVYFLEDVVSGHSLDKIQAKLTVCEVVDVAIQLVGATEHLFEKHSVVHRDVKPANVMIDKAGQVFLMDVGIGRHLEKESLTDTGWDPGPGSKGFRSPEQLDSSMGGELDWRSDQFCVGIVTFLLLTGRLPFDPDGKSYRVLLSAGLVNDWSGIPDALRPALTKMLSGQPHERFRKGRASVALESAKEQFKC